MLDVSVEEKVHLRLPMEVNVTTIDQMLALPQDRGYRPVDERYPPRTQLLGVRIFDITEQALVPVNPPFSYCRVKVCHLSCTLS